jgi:hypothetical protein
MMGIRVLCVAVLLVTAGCAGLSPGGSDGTGASTPTPNPTVDSTPDPTPEPTPTAEPIDPDNPYNDRTLLVYVSDQSSTNISREEELNATFEYWSKNSGEYAGYPVNFTRTDSKAYADILVTLRDEIDQCGTTVDLTEPNNLGCADLVESSDVADSVHVEIVNTLIRNDTVLLLQHEFGHALGLEHGDEPAGVMNETMVARPQSETINYSVSIADEYDKNEAKRQVGGAVSYLNRGANGTIIPNLTFQEVDDPSKAFIHFDITTDSGACDGNFTCTDDNYECVRTPNCIPVNTNDTDGDEEFTNEFVVRTANVKESQIGYAIAMETIRYPLYSIYYAEGLPQKFLNGNVDTQSDWWEE